MDPSITLLTPETMHERGADAFDQGLGQDDHGMNEASPARKHWQAGWHQQRVARSCAHGNHIADVSNMVDQQLAGANPP